MKRLEVSISAGLHKRLSAASEYTGRTMRQLVEEAIECAAPEGGHCQIEFGGPCNSIETDIYELQCQIVPNAPELLRRMCRLHAERYTQHNYRVRRVRQ